MHPKREARERSGSALGTFAAIWGVLGVAAVLLRAIWNLAPKAIEALRSDLSLASWLVTAAWIGFMGYSEGYRGFQRGFSPRVVARAAELAAGPTTWVRALLAPLYCMSLFAAERRRMIVSWSLAVGIVGLILVVSQLAQPWRGIIDAGVVVGLTWGLLALLAFVVIRLVRPVAIEP